MEITIITITWSWGCWWCWSWSCSAPRSRSPRCWRRVSWTGNSSCCWLVCLHCWRSSSWPESSPRTGRDLREWRGCCHRCWWWWRCCRCWSWWRSSWWLQVWLSLLWSRLVWSLTVSGPSSYRGLRHGNGHWSSLVEFVAWNINMITACRQPQPAIQLFLTAGRTESLQRILSGIRAIISR